jgi:hypothetical protein
MWSGLLPYLVLSEQYRIADTDRFRHLKEKKVLAVCSAGHYCKVEGQVDDCKDSGECGEITNISSVSRKKPTMDQRIECVGVLKSYPVHVGDIDHPRLKDGHGGLVVTMDTGRTQSKDCGQWFDGKNWKKVNDMPVKKTNFAGLSA